MTQIFKECSVCGALVIGLNDKLHTKWHSQISNEYVKVKYSIVVVPSDDVSDGAE